MRIPAPALLLPALLASGTGILLRQRGIEEAATTVTQVDFAERDAVLSQGLADSIQPEVIGMFVAAALCVLVGVVALARCLPWSAAPAHRRFLGTGSLVLAAAFGGHGLWLTSIAGSHGSFAAGDVEGILAATELHGSAPLIGAGLTGAMALVALLSLVGARGVDARGVVGALGTLLLLAPHAVLETLGWGDHEAALAEHHRGWNLDALEGVQLPEGPAGDVEAPVEGWLVADGSQPARELPQQGWLITAESTHEHPLVQLLSLGGLRLRSAGGATLFVVDADQVELRRAGEQPELLGVGEEAAELLAAHPQKAEMALVPGPYWSVDELVLLCQAVNPEGSCPIAEEAPENPPAPRQAARVGGGGGGAGGVVAPAKVKAVVGKYRGQVRFCYEQALKKGNPGGKVTLRFTIDGRGKVTSAKATGTKDPQFHACVERRARTWSFPEGNAGEIVYPFVLSGG